MTDNPIKKPLLAATVEADDIAGIQFPVMWSPKLDGWRTLILDKATDDKSKTDFVGPIPGTRKFNPLPNLKQRARLSRPELLHMDGEIASGPITDPDVYNNTQRIVAKGTGPDMDQPCWLYDDKKGKPCMSLEPVEGGRLVAYSKFYVFDDFSEPNLPFEQRYAKLVARVAALPADLRDFVELVKHPVLETAADLANVERIAVEEGYEGIMLRSLAGRYKQGRSTVNELILGKVKRFEDTDGVIVGFEEMFHNDNEAKEDAHGHTKRSSSQENMRPAGTLGALIVMLPDFGNQTVRVGSGYDAALKQQIWDNQTDWHGETVVLKYQASGMKELPRFPVFKGKRAD